MSPFNAWVMLKGLETLPLRVAQQMANAIRIADFLSGQKRHSAVCFILSATITRNRHWPAGR